MAVLGTPSDSLNINYKHFIEIGVKGGGGGGGGGGNSGSENGDSM